MLTAENLIVQSLRAVVVAQVKAGVPILVLNNKLDSQVTGPRTHGFQLQRSVIARLFSEQEYQSATCLGRRMIHDLYTYEHPALIVAGFVNEVAGFLFVGPGRAVAVALG